MLVGLFHACSVIDGCDSEAVEREGTHHRFEIRFSIHRVSDDEVTIGSRRAVEFNTIHELENRYSLDSKCTDVCILLCFKGVARAALSRYRTRSVRLRRRPQARLAHPLSFESRSGPSLEIQGLTDTTGGCDEMSVGSSVDTAGWVVAWNIHLSVDEKCDRFVTNECDVGPYDQLESVRVVREVEFRPI